MQNRPANRPRRAACGRGGTDGGRPDPTGRAPAPQPGASPSPPDSDGDDDDGQNGDAFFADEDDLFRVEEEITPAAPPELLATDDDDAPGTWGLSLAGAYTIPVGDLSSTRSSGLSASLGGSWTGAWGFGGRVALQYSPLPHQPVEADEFPTARTGHIFSLALAPMYALRVGSLRVWGAPGGALVAERRKVVTETAPMTGVVDNDFGFGVAASATAGVDYLLFSDGGPSVSTEFLRSLAGDTYGYIAVRAGLSFVF